MTTWILGTALIFGAGAHDTAMAGEANCGTLTNSFGPFDYRDPTKKAELNIVEVNHFTAEVRSLQRGKSSFLPINDLDYTLRAFPNHYLALDAMMRYELAGGKIGEFRDTECYFDRARRFVPNDGKVWLLYGIYEARRNRPDDARKAFERANELLPDSIEAAYNLGLAYLKLGDGELAMEYAKKAYEGGYPLPGLRNALQEAGFWRE